MAVTEDDDVGSEENPLPVTLPTTVTTDVGASGDRDCWRFTLTAAATITAIPSRPGNAICDDDFDTVVTVYEGRNAIAVGDDNDDTGSLCGAVSVDVGVGVYSVCVEEYDGFFALNDLSLQITSTAVAGVVDEAGNALQPLTATLPVAMTTTIAPRFDSDCVQVVAPVGRTFFSTHDSVGDCADSDFDTLLEVFENGALVADDDDGGAGLCSHTAVDRTTSTSLVVCTSMRSDTSPAASTAGVTTLVRSGRRGLMIAAVDYDTPGADTDEAVVIVNSGRSAVNLTGLFLASVNGKNGALLKAIALGTGSLAAGRSLVIAQNPSSFGGVGSGVIAAGSTSFLQNGGPGGEGDGVMIVDATGAAGVIVDAVAWNGAVSANAVTVGGTLVSGSLVEGTATRLRDSAVSARGLCRRHNDAGVGDFDAAQDSNDHAADLAVCEF